MKLSPESKVGVLTLGDLLNQRTAQPTLLETVGSIGDLVEPQIIPPRDPALPCPLSPSQQRLWFIEQLSPGALAYNEVDAVRLTGNLNVEALERAFNIIVGRHELLRSTIEVTDGEPFFTVHDAWPLEFKKIDLGALTDCAKQAELQRLLVNEPREPYKLETSPGVRVTLVHLGPQEHVFMLMMHHIICDWFSVGVIWRELSAAYRSLLRDGPLNLPTLPIQHGDYAAWKQKQTGSASFAKDLAFWKETLKDAPELLELPADRSRPSVGTNRGARKRFQIDSTLTAALRQLSRQKKASLFTIFAAGLNVLLHRYTRSTDILIGIPLADRDRPELQSMIGFLLDTQVLRNEVTGGMTFSALVGSAQEAVLEMFVHRSVPFDYVVREVGQERNLGYSPLFQVMLNWRNREQSLSFIGMEGVTIESVLAESKISKFDLTFMATDEGKEICLEVEYSTDLFDEARIVRMVGHYQTLLAAAAANPEQQISELPLLTEPERRQILVEWNRAEGDFPVDRTLPQRIEEQVRRTPEAVALVCENRQLTYRELNAKANQLARHLQKLGVCPDTLVGICVERSLEMVIGLLGILKAGGAYVPLDPEYPKERLAFMLEDAAVAILLTQDHLVKSLPACSAKLIRLDADAATIARESELDFESGVKPEHLAYIIYTSGSTGRPKGVMVTHQNVARLFAATQAWFEFDEQDVWTLFHSFAFDFSVWEIWGALHYGGRLVIVPYGVSRSPADFYALLARERVTVLNQTPSAFRQLIQAEQNAPAPLDLALRLVIFGGEALEMQSLKPWFERHGDQQPQLVNMYGITETTVHVTYRPLNAGDLKAGSVIGEPIPDLEIYLLDAYGQPVPIGVPGEIFVGGAGVARGYLNRPELTADRFIVNPLRKPPGARLYKSGDLARWLPNGDIEYLGRADTQVKIRGHRIELGEIESTLVRHPAVSACVIIAREDVPGDQRLVAYIFKQNGAVNSPELREFLHGKLPDYMVPSAFVPLDALPLTHNGKVDLKALPKPDFEAGVDKGKFVAPTTTTEIIMEKIWCGVLGLTHIGINDDFFELGGHSMLAVRLIDQINKSLITNLSILAFFQNPTIRKLAIYFDQANRDKRENKLVSTRESDELVVAFQSKGTQLPLFFLHGDWAGGGLYCGRLSQYLGEDQPFYAFALSAPEKKGS